MFLLQDMARNAARAQPGIRLGRQFEHLAIAFAATALQSQAKPRIKEAWRGI